MTDEVGFGLAIWDVVDEVGVLDGVDSEGTGKALRNTQLLHESYCQYFGLRHS
jgi:hypothetical protein